jgi:hypothetical protein
MRRPTDQAGARKPRLPLPVHINVGKGTINMMVFDTTARAAYLSRGPDYKAAWRKFVFGAKP